ncbi:6-phosphogluconolactonase [Corallococcus praedator]|uniref:6-phosphogluconolactonase n=2 Tax=Corallococcus TaxID=83461 RepID=A0ABX9QBC3_9BACT|nr:MULTISPECIES: 6-phosphogluconolactonase [Corallococcus]RKH16311.1 6-phosphogluconolactonase [Corallococcus sp. CA047B]RKH30215.1 6-phosphogluconolactonase [Corallococcus sp. CA031C]RKH99829.1 6-phosphogluconolactonase [Corallococcus praedator]
MTKPLIVPPEKLTLEASDWLARELQKALATKQRVSLALSGGNTPRPAYRALAEHTLPWERVDVYFVDERFVPPDHADSNYKLVKESLLTPLKLSDAQVFRMQGEREDRDDAAADYAKTLPERLDVVLIGVGEDGHTASLFPGHPALSERTARVLAVKQTSKPPPWRMTLTFPVLQGAGAVLGLVAGEGKRDAMRRVLQGDMQLPASHVTNTQWMLDPAAYG